MQPVIWKQLVYALIYFSVLFFEIYHFHRRTAHKRKYGVCTTAFTACKKIAFYILHENVSCCQILTLSTYPYIRVKQACSISGRGI